MLPGLNGIALCRHLKQRHLTRLIPVVLLTGLDRHRKMEAIQSGADDFLTKPLQFAELLARVASLVRLKRYTDDLESAQSVILSLARTVEARDPYTARHCERLAAYASVLGRTLGLADDDIAALGLGGYLHDVGKVGVPDAVLLKSGPLTEEEHAQMRAHTIIGEHLCCDLRTLRPVRPIIRHHHERLDGSGYPDGLRGDAIPITAQIVGLVDAYDAMTTNRPYRRALTDEAACNELLRDARALRFDSTIARAFVAMDRSAALKDVLSDFERQAMRRLE
jgi:putative two-component system response regulator